MNLKTDASGKVIVRIEYAKSLGVPWGITVKDDLMYLVDGTANGCLLIVRLKDGKVVDRIEGLVNPTAVAIDSHGAIYVGEVSGTNVKKFVKK